MRAASETARDFWKRETRGRGARGNHSTRPQRAIEGPQRPGNILCFARRSEGQAARREASLCPLPIERERAAR
jgi:hypothetical protein